MGKILNFNLCISNKAEMKARDVIEKIYFEELDKMIIDSIIHNKNYDYYSESIQITREVLSRHSDAPLMLIDFLVECVEEKIAMEYEYLFDNIVAIDKIKETYRDGLDKLKDNEEYDFYSEQIQIVREVLPFYDVPISIIESLIECVEGRIRAEYDCANKKIMRYLKKAK